MPNYKARRPGRRRVVLWAKGKRHEWIIQGGKAEADDFEARKRLELRVAGPTERRVAGTFSDLSEEYAVHAEQHLKSSTWRKVRIYQLATLGEHFGSLRLPELGPPAIAAFKLARLKDKVTASSVNNELRVLRAVLNWGREMGHAIPQFKWAPLPVRGSPRVRAFSCAELERLWAACRSRCPELLPMLVFLVNTGCRKGEALACEWSWVDFEAGMIRIPSNEVWQPKSGKPREVPISDAVRAVLSGPRRHKRWVFPNQRGGRFVDFPKDIWWEITEAAELTGGPHQLRHTFASHFLQAEPDLFLLAQVLGHSHGRVTEIYAHLLPSHLERARNRVNLSPGTVAVAVAAGGKRKRK